MDDGEGLPAERLPLLPGRREMAVRRMAERRTRLVRDLAAQRQAAGLSQTEVAARMGTSQSAVARLESGTADLRASTLERYAAAIGGEITWHAHAGHDGPGSPGGLPGEQRTGHAPGPGVWEMPPGRTSPGGVPPGRGHDG